MRQWRGEAKIALCVLVALGCTACASPGIEIDSSTDDAPIFIDGQLRGSGKVKLPWQYYGTMEVATAPPPELRSDRREARMQLGIPEPVTPWFFPFDFLIELAIRSWSSDPGHQLTLTTSEPSSGVAEGIDPPEADAFRLRAREVRTER